MFTLLSFRTQSRKSELRLARIQKGFFYSSLIRNTSANKQLRIYHMTHVCFTL